MLTTSKQTTPPAPTKDLLLTPEQAAGWLNLPVSAIKTLHRMHSMRGVVVARRLMFHPDTVRGYVDSLRSKK